MKLQEGDALVIVHIQKDFLPGGALAVPDGEQVVPVMNRYIERFEDAGLPIFATRDWHPPNHCSFHAQGGPWPEHCVAGSPGAEFAPWLKLPGSAAVVSAATNPEREAYSGFDGTNLTEQLRARGVTRLFIGGLATDYCVVSTVMGAVAEGFTTIYLRDASRAINAKPGDGEATEKEMKDAGVLALDLASLSA